MILECSFPLTRKSAPTYGARANMDTTKSVRMKLGVQKSVEDEDRTKRECVYVWERERERERESMKK